MEKSKEIKRWESEESEIKKWDRIKRFYTLKSILTPLPEIEAAYACYYWSKSAAKWQRFPDPLCNTKSEGF